MHKIKKYDSFAALAEELKSSLDGLVVLSMLVDVLSARIVNAASFAITTFSVSAVFSCSVLFGGG